KAHAEQVAHRGVSAIGADDVARGQLALPGVGGQLEANAGAVIGQAFEPMGPAQVDAQRPASVQEELLDLGLVDVDEGREVVRRGARQLDAEQLSRAVIGAADAPLDATPGDALTDADSRPDLERLTLHAERLRPLAE